MNEGTKPTPEFEAWAKSFSGCDGADLNAPIWICGIEDGGDGKSEFKNISKDDLHGITYDEENTEDKKHFQKFFTGNPYDMNALKLHASIFGEFTPEGDFIINNKHEPSPEGVRKYAKEHRA